MSSIIEHKIDTNEIVEIPLTGKSLENWQKATKETELKAEADAQAEAKKAADKTALLTKLNITEDEARLLLG